MYQLNFVWIFGFNNDRIFPFLEHKIYPSTKTLNSFNHGLKFRNKGFNWVLKYKYLILCMCDQCNFLTLCKI